MIDDSGGGHQFDTRLFHLMKLSGTCSRVESMHVLDPKSHVDSRLIVDTARSVARMDGT